MANKKSKRKKRMRKGGHFMPHHFMPHQHLPHQHLPQQQPIQQIHWPETDSTGSSSNSNNSFMTGMQPILAIQEKKDKLVKSFNEWMSNARPHELDNEHKRFRNKTMRRKNRGNQSSHMKYHRKSPSTS